MRKGLVAALLLSMMGCQQPSGGHQPPENPATLLRAEPSRTDLGTVKPGSRHEVKVTIANPGQAVVTITKLESSCECLTLELPKQTWQPGETVVGKLVVDLSKEPEFRGDAALLFTAADSQGQKALSLRCDLSAPSETQP